MVVIVGDILIYLPLIITVWLPIAIYCYFLHTNSYWKRHKIPFIPAKPIVGNLLDVLLFRKCVAETFDDIYRDNRSKDQPFVGMHVFHKPSLLIKDPELIKTILIKDFTSFSDRHSASDMHSDMIGSASLFFIRNPAWKILRGRLSPFFSSGKMKQMFHLVNKIGNEMNELMLSFNVDPKSKSFATEIKELCARYTTDVVASCAFGIEANSLKNPENEFRKSGKRVFYFSWKRAIEFLSMFLLPEIMPYFNFKVFSKESSKFLRDSINYVMGEREKSGIIRNDLIDTLISLKNEDKSKHSSAEIVFKGDAIVAQAAIFFSAGFETSSTAMQFALYELSFKPEMQTRLRLEIKETLQKSNGELTYDNVNEMVYLNMIVHEILRMYPSLPFVHRVCTSQEGYDLEDFGNFVIPKGMPIFIPSYSLQRDPKHWKNPNQFDPERFSAENKANINPYTNLPFGTGPHNCVGERLGILQTKIGIVNFFKNHYVRPCEKTPRVIKLERKALMLQSTGGITLNFVREPLF